jgi:hypothetical protein
MERSESDKSTIDTPQSHQHVSMSKQTTFLHWLNWRLQSCSAEAKQQPVTDLSYDLRSGVVLHQIVAVLTGQPSPANHGDSRLDRLGNLQSLINILQRERTHISDQIDTEKILEGDLEQTVNLIWIIIFRFELQERFNSKEWDSYSIDQILVAWITTTLSKSASSRGGQLSPTLTLNSFHLVFHDGLLLCQLLLAIDPNLPGIQECTEQTEMPGRRRWTVLLRVIENRFQVPQLFSADEVANKLVNKDCILLYLSLLYFQLRPEGVTPDLVDKHKVSFNPELPACAVNSPVKQKFRAGGTRFEVEGLDGWMRSMEDALSWIMEAEEHLHSVHNLGHRTIQTVRMKFYAHEDFMLELQNHQEPVGKLLSRGKELIGVIQDPQRQIEIRLQSKLLLDRWEKVRDLAMKKQASLHQLIMSLQMEQILSLKEWMTNTEDRISRLEAISTEGCASAKRQLQEATEFQASLEAQHAAVSSIANFILVDTEEADSIEDQLAGIGERWSMISRCIEERLETLGSVTSVLTNQEYLDTYLDQVTANLKSMENELDLDSQKIETQQSLIKVS